MVMGCVSSEEDDVAPWKAEAEGNDLIAAAELYFLARPEERVPWRCLLGGDEGSPPPFVWSRPRSSPRWGRRRPRSRAAAGKEEKEAVTWSPTTPLSWSGGSGSSSGGEKGKRRRSDGFGFGFGGGGGSGGSLVAAAFGGSVAKAEMPGVEDRVDGRSPAAAKRRQGKRKMTLGELKDHERSLLDERRELQKEVEEQRVAHRLLLEENERLRSLGANVQLRAAVPRPTEACTVAEGKMENKRCLPFDLNLSLPDELDAAC